MEKSKKHFTAAWSKVESFAEWAKRSKVLRLSYNHVGIVSFAVVLLIIGIVALNYGSANTSQTVTVASFAEALTVQSDASFVDQKYRRQLEYLNSSINEFIENPNKQNLSSIGLPCYDINATFGLEKVEKAIHYFINRQVDNPKIKDPDIYAQKVCLLLKYCHYFTDYVYDSPEFSYESYVFRYDDDLPDNEKWQVSNNGQPIGEMTWDQIICLVMDVEYVPVISVNSENPIEKCISKSRGVSPRFVGPTQT